MIYAIFALFPYMIFLLANRYASQRMSPIVFVAIANVVAAIVPVSLFLASKIQGKQLVQPSTSPKAYGMAILAGICISLYGLLQSRAFATSNVAIAGPIILGGSIVFGAIGAYIVFHEKINLLQFAGMVLIVAGISLVILSRARA